MRIVFAGTPEFAGCALRALLDAGHEVVGVLSQPDRPSGRGMKLVPSVVKQIALDTGIPVFQPRSLRLEGKFSDEAQHARQALADLQPDVMVVAAYGLILPQWVLDLPAKGCLNIHASLLPRWRGAAPIQRAIEAGDRETGITIMQMDAGLDTGDILSVLKVPIGPDDTAATLHDTLAQAGGRAVLEVLGCLRAGQTVDAIAQPADGITYAEKLQKSEAALDFSLDAATLARRVRSFDPFPGATMRLPGIELPVKVWGAKAVDAMPGAAFGTIVRATPEGIDIATSDGVLRIVALQKAGGRRQPVAQFMQGWSAP